MATATAAQQTELSVPGDRLKRPIECRVELSRMLKLSPFEFDQTNKGWRSVFSNGACLVPTADLISAYRKANWGKLDPPMVAISYWHEGQVRAMAGQTNLAIPLLLAGVRPGANVSTAGQDGESSLAGIANAEYALATVAFLQGDLTALRAARGRLAAIPKPAMRKTVRGAESAAGEWPPNLNIVDGLIDCFGKPYTLAYGCSR